MADKYEDEEAEVARIMALSHDELIAECIARGEDPAKVIEDFDRMVSRAKADAYFRQKMGWVL